MGVVGADVEALEALARQMGNGADHLDRIRGQLHSAFRLEAWRGHDAAMYRTLWARTYEPSLTRAATGLRHTAEVLRKNAREQRDASSVETGGAVGGGTASHLFTLPPALLGLLGGGLSAEAVSRIAEFLGDHVFQELSTLVDGLDLPDSWAKIGARAGQLEGISASLAGFGLVSFLFGQFAPEHTFGRLAGDGLSHLFEAGSADAAFLAKVASHGASVTVLGPALGLLSGTVGMVGDFARISHEGYTGRNVASLSGHGLVTVGSAMMLIPVPGAPQVVGAGLVALGTTVNATVWAYDHREDIERVLGAGAERVGHAAQEVGHAVSAVDHAVVGAASGAAHSVEHAASAGWNKLKGLF